MKQSIKHVKRFFLDFEKNVTLITCKVLGVKTTSIRFVIHYAITKAIYIVINNFNIV